MIVAQALLDDIKNWRQGRSWLLRAPLVLYCAWVAVRQFCDPETRTIFAAINLGIHEGGHLLFKGFGLFLCVAGGTILQLAAPLASVAVFLRQRDYFGITICLGWLSTNLYEISAYMDDAQDMALPW